MLQTIIKISFIFAFLIGLEERMRVRVLEAGDPCVVSLIVEI